ncbi:hypothetical protein KQI84_00250 [bacterium]|nr:hypothetical protein [bacterium]
MRTTDKWCFTILITLCVLLGQHVGADLTTAVWQGSTNTWSNAASWDVATVPDNDASTTYSVKIDDGSTGTNSVVTLNQNATIIDLTVDSGDELTFSNGNTLTVDGSTSVTNNGTISLGGSSSITALVLADDTLLTGSGELVLNNQTNDRLRIADSSAGIQDRIIHDTDHTIRGTGTIDSSGVFGWTEFVNRGLIRADASTRLRFSPGLNIFSDDGGRLEATGSGGLEFNGGYYMNFGNVEIQDNSVLYLSGSTTFSTGTLTTQGTGTIETESGSRTFQRMTLAGTLNHNNADYITVFDEMTNDGLWNVKGSSSATEITIYDTAEILGSGEIVLENQTYSQIYLRNLNDLEPNQLTNGTNHTIRGMGSVSSVGVSGNFVNQGTVRADATGRLTFSLGAGVFSNTGTVQAVGSGGLEFSGGYYSNFGTVDILNGSKLYLNTSATLSNGELLTQGTGTIETESSITFNNVTLGGTFNHNNGDYVTLFDGVTNNGTWNVNSSGGTTEITVYDTAALDGTGEILLKNKDFARLYLRDLNPLETNQLTQGANHTIRGTGQITAIGESGNFINQGSILADSSNRLRISLGAGIFSNTGTVQATGSGGLELYGGYFSNFGNIEALDGSALYLNGSAHFTNGQLSTQGTGFIEPEGSVTLDTVTLAGAFNHNNGIYVTLQNQLTNNGTYTISSSGSTTELSAYDTVAINGTGEIVLQNQNNASIHYRDLSAAPNQITHGANHTIRGTGEISGITVGGNFINQGTILADASGRLIIALGGGIFSDSGGTLRATGSGGLELASSYFSNFGNIEVLDGSKLYLSSVQLTTGTLTTAGTGTVEAEGSITAQGVTLDCVLNQDDGDSFAGFDSIVNNGTWTMNGTSANTYVTMYDTVDLTGNGTLYLNSDTYDIFTISDLSPSESDAFTNGVNHTIRGVGAISGGHFENEGTLIADQATPLRVAPGSKGFHSTGTLSAPAGNVLNIDAVPGTGFENLNATTHELRDGTYLVAGTLQIRDGLIHTNSATVELDGVSAQIIDQSSQDALRQLSTNSASGSLTLMNSQLLSTSSAFSTAGNLIVASGSQFVTADTFEQAGGFVTLDNGTISAASGVLLVGGDLSGNGSILGSILSSGGSVSPGLSPGTLSVTGDYEQDALSSLNLEIEGYVQGSQFDLLDISGSATLGGTANIDFSNGFVPALDDTFDVITYSSRASTFDTVSIIGYSGSESINLVYDTNAATVIVGDIPTISINSLSIPEGDVGHTISLTVSLDKPVFYPVEVDFETQDGSAVSTEDYQATQGTLTIDPSFVTGTISIDIQADVLWEPEENFSVVLSNAVNGSIITGTGLVTIQDDDASGIQDWKVLNQ